MDEQEQAVHFLSLVASLATSAMQGLGQIENPVTKKKEKDLDSVKYSIDLLMMLRDKTQKNLSTQEDGFLNETVSKLQMAYVDAVNRKGGKSGKDDRPEAGAPENEGRIWTPGAEHGKQGKDETGEIWTP